MMLLIALAGCNVMQEAYVKAVGKGIGALPFRNFSFNLRVSPNAHELLRKVTKLPTDPQVPLRCHT
jgi:5,10-methylene-tetrahydrofolate dehydrogenase/methenyl tetrahydrofolate cyclohydrolase